MSACNTSSLSYQHFRKCCPIADLDEDAADERRIYANGISELGNVYKFFGRLQDAATISARWCRIEEAERPTGGFLPSPLLIAELKKWGSQFRFWPRVESKKRGPRAAKAGVAALEDAPRGGDAEASSDSEPDPDEGAGAEEADVACLDLLEPLLEAFEAPLAPPDPAPLAGDEGE